MSEPYKPSPAELAEAAETEAEVLEELKDHAAEHYAELAGKTVPAGMLLGWLDLYHRSVPADGYDPDGHTKALAQLIRGLAS